MRSSLKKKIILGLASTLDEAVDWWEVATSPYLFLKSSHYKKQTIYNTVSNLLKVGYLEKKVKDNGEVVYRVTSWGKTKIMYDVPLARYTGKKWDGIWRLVSFDIPEKKATLRVWLRNKLKELGFGMLQESLWITPHELGQMFAEFLEHENLKDYCVVWEAKTIFGENEEELVRKVFRLEELHRKYLDLTHKFAKIFSSKRLVKQRKQAWEEEYFAVLAADPGLPRQLLPDYWLFEKARSLFKKLKTSE